MKENQGIMPWFGSQPVPACQRTLSKSGEEKREEWSNKCDGERIGEDKLSGTRRNGSRERRREMDDGCGVWQGCAVSRRPVAQGADSCPSVCPSIIPAHTAPIWNTLPTKAHLQGEAAALCACL